MIKDDSVLKTAIGRKAFHFCGNLGKYTNKTCLSMKAFNEKVKESDENFKVMFHLRRSDFESWLSKILNDEECVSPARTFAATLQTSTFQGGFSPKVSSAGTVPQGGTCQ